MANLKKHQISFEEAQSVFYDEFGIQFFDNNHSPDEDRFLMLGLSSGAKLLIVCHCEREDGDIVRIISARMATKRESWHPLFQRHPISGRLALFLSTPARCQAITGLPDDTAKRVIKALYRHSIRPSRLYRHAWQPGDVLVWDNRCTMHRADHAQVSSDRVLHRGLVLPAR